MDNDFKRTPKRALPSYRGTSELPENSMTPTLSDTPTNPPASTSVEQEDPTDLTLDREKGIDLTLEPAKEEKPKKFRRKTSKKEKIILFTILGLVIIGAAVMVLLPRFQKEEPVATTEQAQETVAKEELPKPISAPLTGLDVTADIAARPVTAVMIENSQEARPQSGLLEADLVFEAIAEGGITRFVAMYQSGLPDKIGPIRSARPYYVDLARTFDAAYVHAGGSPDALARISELGIKDMSAFENNGTYYRAEDRDAPHDLYSSITRLDTRRSQLGFSTSTYESWKHKNDTPQTPSARTIDIAISSPLYNVSYSYDAASNSYPRSVGGEPHTDQVTSKQISPKVVIGLITSRGQNGIYSEYRLTGSGEMMVFQDGVMSRGTWSKEGPTAQFVFKDKNGLDFNFNKGQAWTTIVDSASDINYAM